MSKQTSQKYMVLAEVDGKIRVLSMRSNASQRRIEELSRQMARKLFAAHAVKDLRVQPWPTEEFTLPSSIEPSLG
ncbi:MAG: hypothetical protein V3R94_03135 [Acidobacteriota bacterium]